MKKQKILTVVIIMATIALIGVIAFAIYDTKSSEEQKIVPEVEEKKDNTTNTVQPEEPIKEEKPNNEYVGQEENDSKEEENKEKTKEEKAIELAQKTWGEDDSVTFNIEEKKENIYYIAVKSNATVISWYEVNTETWTISEFY